MPFAPQRFFWVTNNLYKLADNGVEYSDSQAITAIVNKNTDSYIKRFENLQRLLKLETFE